MSTSESGGDESESDGHFNSARKMDRRERKRKWPASTRTDSIY